MGFLDKLLGRGKDVAESAQETAKDLGDKATDTFDEAKSRIGGEDTPSEVGDAEQRLDDIRDDAARNEGRMP